MPERLAISAAYALTGLVMIGYAIYATWIPIGLMGAPFLVFTFMRMDFITQRRWLLSVLTRSFMTAACAWLYFESEPGSEGQFLFGVLTLSMLVTALAFITGGLRGVWSFARADE